MSFKAKDLMLPLDSSSANRCQKCQSCAFFALHLLTGWSAKCPWPIKVNTRVKQLFPRGTLPVSVQRNQWFEQHLGKTSTQQNAKIIMQEREKSFFQWKEIR